MPCADGCAFCRPRVTQDERALAALRRDVAMYRQAVQAALDIIATRNLELRTAREIAANAREELRRYTQAVVVSDAGPHKS